MQRLIVTGANGAGKSHLAAQLAKLRPEVPLVSYDALKLTRNWQQRPRGESDAALQKIVDQQCWILEGGPSLLPLALPRADALIWLDPPFLLRAWRLAKRPLGNVGRTRAEIPDGNVDWPWQQYCFAWRSLSHHRQFRRAIAAEIAVADHVTIWRVRHRRDLQSVLGLWQKAAGPERASNVEPPD